MENPFLALPNTAQHDADLAIKKANEAKSFARNLAEGAALGFKKAGAGALELGANLVEALGLGSNEEARSLLAEVQQEYNRRGQGTGVGGFIGEIAGNPATYTPGKILASAALQGATLPTGNKKSSIKDTATNAAASGLFALGGQAVGKGLGKIARPVAAKTSENAQKLLSVLDEAGVPLTAAQRTNSQALAGLESVFEKLPFTSVPQRKILENQADQFTQAVLKKAGITSKDAGRETIAAAQKQFGAEYADLAARNAIKIDEPLLQNVADAYYMAQNGRLGTDASRLVEGVAKDIYNSGDIIPGEVYQQTRSLLGAKANSTTDSFERQALKGLRNALDDAFSRSVPKSEQAALKDLNARYSAFKPIEKAMQTSKASSVRNATIDPVQLYAADRIGSPISELSDAGAAYIRPMVNDSGTATRQFWQNALTQTPLVAGGALSAYGATNNNDLALGVGAALALPRTAQKIYNSKSAQNYLVNGLGDNYVNAASAVEQVLPRTTYMGIQQEQQPNEQLQNYDLPIEQNPFLNTAQDQSSKSYTEKLFNIESGNNINAKNPQSSALGPAQFIDSTWRYMVQKYGKKYGLTNNGRTNPQQVAIATELYAAQNADKLSKSIGREVAPHEVYMAHFLGAGGASKLLKSNPLTPAAQVLPKAAASNQTIFFKNGKPLSVAEVYKLIQNKWESA